VDSNGDSGEVPVVEDDGQVVVEAAGSGETQSERAHGHTAEE